MKVKDCLDFGCPHCRRFVWTQQYKPADYHTIGISHGYYFCVHYGYRCRRVKRCEPWERRNENAE